MEFCFRYSEMKGHIAGAEDSPVNRSLTMMIYESFKNRAHVSHTCLPVGDASSSPISVFIFHFRLKKVYKIRGIL